MHLAQFLFKEAGLTEQEPRKSLPMTDALAAGDRVKIRGFRSIHDKKYKGYKVTNPNTRESVQVSPNKRPFLKCGQEQKERVDDIQA